MADADAPFSTSTLSMSLGFRSAIRLTVFDSSSTPFAWDVSAMLVPPARVTTLVRAGSPRRSR